MTRRRGVLLGVGAVVAVMVLGTTAVIRNSADAGGSEAIAEGVHVGGPPDAALPVVDTAALVAGVDHAQVAVGLVPARLADGLVPPTNRWFSGLVFGDQPQPVFALPLSFALTGTGFGIGLPSPVTSAKLIAGPHVAAVTVDVGAVASRVSAYDAVTVTVDLLDGGGGVIGRVLVAEGSPFVTFTATADTTLTLGTAPGSAFGTTTPESASVVVAGTEWVLSAPDGAFDGTSVRLAAGRSATWYPVPQDADADAAATLALAATDPVVGSESTYGLADGVARTTVGYRTAQGSPTAYVTMPHHRAGAQPERDGCTLGTYPSIYGTLELCGGSRLTSWAPAVPPAATLDLTAVPDERRAQVVAQLRDDVASTPAFPSDTYFGGKALYRAATLVVLGEELDAADVVAPLREKVVAALREWTEPGGCTRRDARCFVYDEQARGVVGLTPSFGSEEFNDHHFHYGYFLAAAGLLAADDPTLVADVRPVLDLLAQDVAAATATEWFPRLRAFDVYAGHAWASGTSPFADGNNQESSSEAVTAWNGLGLWARASGQDDLAVQATWLASTEAASARAYWTAPDLDDPLYDGFEHEVLALAWGGKRDYATWFSPEPSAMLGIQLIPMSPAAGYLVGGTDDAATRAERIRAQVAEAAPAGYDVQFGDYLLMYLALAGQGDAEVAWEAAAGLPDASVDDGSSRAYLLAWLASVASGSGPGSAAPGDGSSSGTDG